MKHHAVDVQEFFLCEQPHTPYKDADGHQAKQGNNAAKRDKKIAQHNKKRPPSIVLYYNRKMEERQRINTRKA